MVENPETCKYIFQSLSLNSIQMKCCWNGLISVLGCIIWDNLKVMQVVYRSHRGYARESRTIFTTYQVYKLPFQALPPSAGRVSAVILTEGLETMPHPD